MYRGGLNLLLALGDPSFPISSCWFLFLIKFNKSLCELSYHPLHHLTVLFLGHSREWWWNYGIWLLYICWYRNFPRLSCQGTWGNLFPSNPPLNDSQNDLGCQLQFGDVGGGAWRGWGLAKWRERRNFSRAKCHIHPSKQPFSPGILISVTSRLVVNPDLQSRTGGWQPSLEYFIIDMFISCLPVWLKIDWRQRTYFQRK